LKWRKILVEIIGGKADQQGEKDDEDEWNHDVDEDWREDVKI